MADRQITQKVIDFQFSRAQMRDQNEQLIQDESSENIKFSEWNLDTVIYNLGLTDRKAYSIKWVGFQQEAFLQAFLYCLFKGCKSNLANKNGIFIRLKHAVYQLASRYLRLGQQRMIVQSLCATQYAKDISHFMSKNPLMVQLFGTLLKNFIQTKRSYLILSQLQALNLFARNFDFLKFESKAQNIAVFHHFCSKYFLVNQKGCYFVIQFQQQKINILELNQILENQNQYSRQMTSSRDTFQPFQLNQIYKNQQQTMPHEQPKKIYEYNAAKFILMNKTPKKKPKKEPRYTQIQIQQDFLAQFRQHSSNAKIKTVDPTLASRSEHMAISHKNTSDSSKMRATVNQKSIQEKSKSRKQKMFYKASPNRIKTGIIESKNPYFKTTSKEKSENKNDITFDQKQSHKSHFKKIQLNLRKVTSQKSMQPLLSSSKTPNSNSNSNIALGLCTSPITPKQKHKTPQSAQMHKMDYNIMHSGGNVNNYVHANTNIMINVTPKSPPQSHAHGQNSSGQHMRKLALFNGY